MSDGIFELRKNRVLEVFYTGGDLKFSADGKYLFSSCANLVKVLDVEDGNELFTVGDPEDHGKVTSFTITDDNHVFVAYSTDIIKKFKVFYNQTTMVHQFRTTHNGPVMAMKVYGHTLLTGSSDFSTKVWNLQLNICTHTLKGPSVVSVLEFLSDAAVLVGYGEGQLRLFDISKKGGAPVRSWSSHSSRVTALIKKKIDSDPSVLILSRDQTATVLSQVDGQTKATLPLFEPIESAVYVKKIDSLVTVGEEGILKFWHPSKATLQAQYRVSTKPLDVVLYNKNQDQLVIATNDQNLLFFDLNTKKLTKHLAGYNDEILGVKFISHETNLIAVATNSPQLRLYNLQNFNCTLVEGHSDTIMSVDSPSWDSHLIATASKDNSVIVWSMLTAEESERTKVRKAAIATGHTNNVTSVKFSHQKNQAFIVTVSNDSTLKLWSLKPIFGKKTQNEEQKLTSDSTIVAHHKDIVCLDVSDNDKLCATGSMDKTVKLWHIDKETMQFGIAGTLSGHKRGVWCVKFSNINQSVLTASGDCTVKLFSLLDLSCQQTFEGHSFAVLTAKFINHDQQIASCDSNGLLKVWNIKTGVCDKTDELHEDKIWAIEEVKPSTEALERLHQRKREDLEKGGDGNVELKPDEYVRFVTAGADGKIIIWQDVTEEIAAENARKDAERRAQIQTLENFLRLEKFAEALQLTLELEHPLQCYKVLNKISAKGADKHKDVIAQLNEAHQQKLLEYAAEWNTNTRTYFTAQLAISALFRSVPRRKLETYPFFSTLVQSLLPYTKRHYDRLQNMKQDTTFINYMTERMQLI